MSAAIGGVEQWEHPSCQQSGQNTTAYLAPWCRCSTTPGAGRPTSSSSAQGRARPWAHVAQMLRQAQGALAPCAGLAFALPAASPIAERLGLS
eukprot:CAMPEP_0115478228 /NCGR_PEP_ID=MMETSP0271-20121206/56092_1 /TAXON_ID=71861 /ORGANISM="Scrippsiella trochoidea, Strain CCMP3099" /LENGTH=92 /DNA_ID=CAMNT_0002905761 /DNA_START=460 /DNA_END=735 /DNA_ORIENTATION=-